MNPLTRVTRGTGSQDEWNSSSVMKRPVINGHSGNRLAAFDGHERVCMLSVMDTSLGSSWINNSSTVNQVSESVSSGSAICSFSSSWITQRLCFWRQLMNFNQHRYGVASALISEIPFYRVITEDLSWWTNSEKWWIHRRAWPSYYSLSFI